MTDHLCIPECAENQHVAARPTDDQDRVLVEYLTDSEKLTEIVNYMRLFTDLMTQLSEQPMIGKMLGLPTTMFKHSHSKL